MSEGIKIPKGWVTAISSNIIDVRDGTHDTPKYVVKDGVPLITSKNLKDGKINFEKVSLISEDDHIAISKRSGVEKGDILFAMIGTIGNPVVIKGNEIFSIKNVGLFRKNEEAIVPEYLYSFLNSRVFEHQLEERKLLKGTTQKFIPLGNLRDIHIPLPPLPEQHRIVAKIEALFSSLDKGIESLKAAQQQLKVYRQAVLKWAFEGKFTNKDVKEGEFPEGWTIKKLKDVAEIKRGKSKHRPRDAKELFGGNYPFIQTGEVRAANGGTIRKYSQTYSEIGLKQSKLWKKDTLCLTIAANIGETAFLGFDACFPDSVVGVVAYENVADIRYLNFYIQRIKQDLSSKASATAQKNLNVEFLEKVGIPISSFSEQQRIVSEIESRLSVCDKIEESISTSLLQAEALRQSILKKAFEGKLVPQDPNDEPASVLLERIKTAQAKAAPSGRKVNSRIKAAKAKAAPSGRQVNSKKKQSINQSSVGAPQKT